MVTIDNCVRNVKGFKGDLRKGRRDYERAKQGIERIKQEKASLDDALKGYTGYNNFNLPQGTGETELRRGEVTFRIKSRRRIKRPQYKTAVTEMENYLKGISFLLDQGRAITGVVKDEGLTYIDACKLLEAYDIIVSGVMIPEVQHTIRYEPAGEIAEEEPLDNIVLKEKRPTRALNADNFANYVRLDRVKEDLSSYVKDYEAELAKGQTKDTKTKAVTSKSAYKTTRKTQAGPNWAYVVMSLVAVPTRDDEEGELNELCDPSYSFDKKQGMFVQYDLLERQVSGEARTYIGIESVYNRIQELKEGKSVRADRLKVEPREVV